MAYNVSNRYREIVYNEEKIYTCSLVINGNDISPSQIAEIRLSRPIIDNTQDAFYIGTFISDKLEVKFKNIEELDIKSGYEVNLSIALRVDETDENGYFKYLDDSQPPNIYWYDSEHGEYVYNLTSDEVYQAYKDYYKYENDEYTLMIEGTDYNVGDEIESNTAYEQSFEHNLYDSEYNQVHNYNIDDYTKYYTNEWVNQGTFFIDNLDENYQKSNEITCFDSSIKFESAIDTEYEKVLTYNYTGKNIFNPSKVTINSDLNLTDGTTSDSENYNTSGYTVVEFGENYVFSNITPTKVCYYNANLDFISSEEPLTSVIQIPNTARFLKFSYSNSNELENPQLELGTEATSYEEFDPSKETWSITLENLLIWVCNKYNVTLGTHPNINRNVITGNWDSTVSGKQYISWIAELMGGNAKINRNNELCIFPLKSEPVVTINALRSKSLEVGEKYYLSQVSFVDALRNQTYTLPDHEQENGNTLFIRQDNIFVPNGETSTESTAIENIFDLNKGYICYSLKNENFADFSLDPWDNLELTAGENSYIVLNNNEIVFNGSGMATIDSQIPTKQQEVTTNITKSNAEESIRKVWSTIDQLQGEISLGASNTQRIADINQSYKDIIDTKFNNYDEKFEKITTTFEETISDLGDLFATTTQLSNGDVTVVKTENVLINNLGVNVYTTDKNNNITSNTIGLYNENGMKVSSVSNGHAGNTVLFSGYVDENNTELSEYVGQTIVYGENLVCKTYANFGKNSRIEDYVDIDNIEKTGMFPLR